MTLFFLLGDTNRDSVVNFDDIPAFIEFVMLGGFLEEADINQDGEVNFMDIQPFIDLLISI